MKATVFIGALLAINAVSAFSQNEGQSSSVPAQMIVTVESRHGRDVPALNREDFMVYQGKERVQLVDALPLQGDNADLELFLLIDDASDWRLGTQLGDLRRFLDAQAAGTAVEIGYMRNGTIDTIAELTKDHTRAAGALRLPMGASPARNRRGGTECGRSAQRSLALCAWKAFARTARRCETRCAAAGWLDIASSGPQRSGSVPDYRRV